MENRSDSWVPFVYRGYYDVPLAVAVNVANHYFFLDRKFSEDKDDYDTFYSVWRSSEPRSLQGSWEKLEDLDGAVFVGQIAVGDVQYRKKERLMSVSALLKLGGV